MTDKTKVPLMEGYFGKVLLASQVIHDWTIVFVV